MLQSSLNTSNRRIRPGPILAAEGQSGKLSTNKLSNLRVLCRYCHTLRADNRHRGMIANALKLGIIPPDWRNLVWED